MALYCDESGGLSAGAMTFAAVAIEPDAADAVLDRFRSVTGLRGELKGSRLSLAERALVFEILIQREAKLFVAIADGHRLLRARNAQESDLALYSKLLDTAVAAFLPTSGGSCSDITIDEGRYDPHILENVRGDIQSMLGNWGRAAMADSRRCAGIQIADVVANSLYNIAIHSGRARRIEAILSDWRDERRLTLINLS